MFLNIRLAAASNATAWRDSSNDTYYVFESSGGSIVLKKRAEYPGTFFSVEGDILKCGYGDVEMADSSEFLHITLNLSTLELQIKRDIFCTLPVFVNAGKELVSLSDDIAEIDSTFTLNKQALASILVKPCIADDTLNSNIKLLGERARLTWRPGSFDLTKTPLADTVLPLQKPSDFKASLESVFDAYLDKLKGTSFAFETSGGIDSSTLPVYAAKKGVQAPLAVMAFHDSFEVTQKQKLTELTNIVQAPIISTEVSKEADYPLARFFAPKFQPHPFYQYQEIYTEALSRQAAALQAQGIYAIYTGIGGDELFEHRASTDTEPPNDYPFLTKEFRAEYIPLLQGYTDIKTYMANSAFYAGQSRNKVYIDHDVWPLSPLSDPVLYRQTQSLPIEFRSNKNILRAYHQAIGSPESIYNPVQNEHFGRFFEDSVKASYDRVLTALQPRSATVTLGIIDWDNLVASFQESRYREHRADLLFAVFRVASVEVILQAVS